MTDKIYMSSKLIVSFILSLQLFWLVNSDQNYPTSYKDLLMNTDEDKGIAEAAQCVLSLSAKYFIEKRALSGSIVIININSYASTTQKILLTTIHEGRKYSIMVKDSLYPHYNASHFPEKAKNYMLILEEKEELKRNILQLNKLPTWNPHAKSVVFYELKDEDQEKETVKGIINDLRVHKLFKSFVFIYSKKSQTVASYTWKPYDENHCGGECDDVFLLDICGPNSQRQVNPEQDMFPLDMKGCPLVVYAVVCEPYVMPPVSKLNNVLYDDAYIFDLGIEVNLLKIIAHFTNMTLIIRTADKLEAWGNITAEGNATDTYAQLRNDSVDLIIGNMQVNRVIRKWFDPTSSYMQDDITWCVPKAGQSITWSNLITIFQWNTWIATFFTLVGMSVIFHFFYFFENRGNNVTKWPTNSFLMTLSMLLGWGSLFNPKSTTFRLLIGTWLLFSINLTISYISFLRGFLIHPRYDHQISDEADLLKSHISIGGRETFKVFLEENNVSDFYFHKKYESKLFTEAIKKTSFGRNFATLTSRRQAEFQDQQLGKGAKLVYCFEEKYNLYKYGVVLLARKWFPMIERFNVIIRSVTENGLIWKWNSEVFIHSSRKQDASDVVPLKMNHLMGAFLFCGFMYAVCIFIFMAEVVSFKFRNL